MIYGHGDDAFRYGDKIKMNFSSNVYSRADYSELKEHLMAHFDIVGHYPNLMPILWKVCWQNNWVCRRILSW